MIRTATATTREVIPIVSANKAQSRSNVLALYKEMQRYAPKLYKQFHFDDMPLSVFRAALKKQYINNAHLTDFRVIDRKIAECRQVMLACQKHWYNSYHLRNNLFRENVEAKPKDFLSTFLRSKN
uniref:BMA-COQ-3 n=1 Tax=Brugia malayi TaxID=6279 RepID=A0A0H5SAA1_BRUMA|nr:BMA-COQ-3 [Brugia malayi]